MANTINALLVDRIYAMGLQALRRKTSLLQYCTRYDGVMGASFQGDTVVIPIPATFDDDMVGDVLPANIPPAPSNITPNFGSVSLTNWKKVSYALTDKEVSFLQTGTFTDQFDAAIDALARNIVRSVWSNFVSVYQAVGVPGVTPFASNLTIVSAARRLLNFAGLPMTKRAMILGFDADANAINLAIFQQYLQSGTDETLREGTIKRAVGFDWAVDGYTPSFLGGTLSNGTAKAALMFGPQAANSTSFDVDSPTLTGTVVKGDIFTVGTDPQQYVITQAATAAGNEITLNYFPPNKRLLLDNEPIVFLANHAIAGMAMHPQAIVFASKPLDNNVIFEGGNMIRQFSDPLSGLTLCLEISRQYHQTVAEFSCLWGSNILRPECAVRIMG
jgi:hypothetical protein